MREIWLYYVEPNCSIMNNKEAKARIKINKLLEESGWRFFDNECGPANIILENNVKLTQKAVDEFGDDFDKVKNGFIDFLLLDDKGFPLIVLEAKKEDLSPLFGKEQARKYAKAKIVDLLFYQMVIFIISGIYNKVIRI